MMNLREKAREIKAEGETTRGDYTPSGTPKKMYDYWLRHTKNPPEGRENFCHYGRVVLFWAPLMFVRNKVSDFVDSPAGFVTTVAVAVLAVLALVFGPLVLIPNAWEFYVIFGAAALMVGALFGVVYLIKTKASDGVKKALGTIALAIGGLVVAALVVGLIGLLFYENGWAAFLIIGGVILSAIALVGLAAGAAALVEASKAKKRAERNKALEAYYDGKGPDPDAKVVREPGIVKKFLSGLGDLIVLTAQFIRVKKWKICPLVDIDTK
jgi:MFS family permease